MFFLPVELFSCFRIRLITSESRGSFLTFDHVVSFHFTIEEMADKFAKNTVSAISCKLD